MIQAVLWDNDGVLVDSEAVFFAVTKRAFARLGLDLTKDTWGTQYLGLGTPTREIARSLGAELADIGSVFDERDEEYLTALKEPPQILPQVPETLAVLSGRVRMAIVTGCHRKQLQLMHASSGILEFFDVVITGDDYGKSKPSPEPYLAAVETLGLNVRHCIAIEDSKRGLESAVGAGISCVVVPTELTEAQDFTGALSVESDVSGVLKYVTLDGNR